MLIQVAPKLAGDTRLTACDFAPLLTAGQTVTGATVTVSVYSGTDASPPTFTPSFSASSVVAVSESGGIAGVIYLVKVVPTTPSTVPAITYLLAILPDQP